MKSWLVNIKIWLSQWIRRVDWYIIKKFLGTYFFAIALIISIAVVFDVNEWIDNLNIKIETLNENIIENINVLEGCRVDITNLPSQIEREISDKTISLKPERDYSIICNKNETPNFSGMDG